MDLRKSIILILVFFQASIFSNQSTVSWNEFSKLWMTNSLSYKGIRKLYSKERIIQQDIKNKYLPTLQLKGSHRSSKDYLYNTNYLYSYGLELNQNFFWDSHLTISHFNNIHLESFNWDNPKYLPGFSAQLKKKMYFGSGFYYGVDEAFKILESSERILLAKKKEIDNILYSLSIYKSLLYNNAKYSQINNSLSVMEANKSILSELAKKGIIKVTELWEIERKVDVFKSKLVDLENESYDLFFILKSERVFQNLNFKDFKNILFTYELNMDDRFEVAKNYTRIDYLLKKNQLDKYKVTKKQIEYDNSPTLSLGSEYTPVNGENFNENFTNDINYSLSFTWLLNPILKIEDRKRINRIENEVASYINDKNIYTNKVKNSSLVGKYILLDKKLNLKTAILNRVREQLEKAQIMFENDFITKLDLMEVEINMSTFEYEQKLTKIDLWYFKQKVRIEYEEKH